MNVSFDTLTAAHDLEAAGLERPQAEAIVKTMRESGRADFANLPTKVDIAEIHTAIANLETRLTRSPQPTTWKPLASNGHKPRPL